MTTQPTHRSSPSTSPTGSHCILRKSAVRIAALVMAGGVIAVLIWMKLKVVGGVPRTAYADPEHEAAPRLIQSAVDDHRPSPGTSQAPPRP
ncbi:MAG: hypothetical protein WCK33_08245 [Phycisphaerae bacterium]|jgi:hypothetical protein